MESRIVWIKQRFEGATAGLVRVLSDHGVTPTQVSVAGLVVTLCSAPLIATGWLTVGSLVFGIGSFADAFDGALARHQGVVSDFGAFLDSTLDRVGEAAGLAGLAAYFAIGGQIWPVVMVVIALLGGNLTSYIRARAESFGIACSDGWFSRVERLLLFGFGMMFHQQTVMIYLLAAATLITALQRFLLVQRAFAARETRAAVSSGTET